MSHFSMQNWMDFVRGVASPEQTAAMRRHLDGTCEQCHNLMETWKFVADFGAREHSFEPPADVVRYVKSCHTLRRGPDAAPRFVNVARLIFDSLGQPLPAGIRGSGPAVRHLLFKSGSFLLDLRLEPQPRSRNVCLVGQVLDSAKAAGTVQQLPVSLQAETAKLIETKSNTFGEFQLEFEMADNLMLVVGLDDAIVVPISDLEPTRASSARLS